ncbi:MAG: hypothetical protein OXE94_00890 [Aestuariivita sp.]|nr:hypothetical protein [Aestuariivita sp.]MCY4201043.1 hypothetical protein [Aestuariivita sp.]MCY4287443.1 hypothetical protein [Aestuariivita sp.]MCY4345508.1 hypothetical protein [Aestuariivita sp.]
MGDKNGTLTGILCDTKTDVWKSKEPKYVDRSPAQHLEEWQQRAFDDAEEIDLSAVVAERYRPDAFEAEPKFQAMVSGFSRSVLKPAFAALDDQRPTLTVDDKSYHQVDVTVGDAMTLFGYGSLTGNG